jgi:CRP/FNR family transcriptional regulator, cyclic AMP receptor protein
LKPTSASVSGTVSTVSIVSGESLFNTSQRVIHVLEADPDLALDIPPDQVRRATEAALAPVLVWSPGPWDVDSESIDGRGHLGMLILDGLLARRVTLGARTAIELLGPGDVLRPWVRSDLTLAEINWTVIDGLRMASLDGTFARRVAEWPQIAGNLSDRILLRARVLAFHLAVCHVVTVEERLLLILWHFAERWGRMTRDGAVVRIGLTHELLAGVVGARRPPVTTALSALAQKGLVHRQDEGTWLLPGVPPESFAELHRQLGSSVER